MLSVFLRRDFTFRRAILCKSHCGLILFLIVPSIVFEMINWFDYQQNIFYGHKVKQKVLPWSLLKEGTFMDSVNFHSSWHV